MKIINEETSEIVYTITGGSNLTLDEALDIVAPEDWREQLNTNVNDHGEAYFVDGAIEVWYDCLCLES